MFEESRNEKPEPLLKFSHKSAEKTAMNYNARRFVSLAALAAVFGVALSLAVVFGG